MSILDLITDISEKHCASLNRIGMRNFENIFEQHAEINVQDIVYKAKINQKEFILLFLFLCIIRQLYRVAK